MAYHFFQTRHLICYVFSFPGNTAGVSADKLFSGGLRAVVWRTAARPLPLRFSPLPQPVAWLLILICASPFPCTSAALCAAAWAADYKDAPARGHWGSSNREGTSIMTQTRRGGGLAQADDAAEIHFMLSGFHGQCSQEQVFEKKRPDKTICWKDKRHALQHRAK